MIFFGHKLYSLGVRRPFDCDLTDGAFVAAMFSAAAFAGEKAQFCSNHKEPGMVDVHNKRCEASDCQKHPTYGLVNGRAKFCTKHKGPDMVRGEKLEVFILQPTKVFVSLILFG